MAVFLPSATKLTGLGFTQVVPGLFARTLPDGSTLHLGVAADHLTIAAGVEAGEPLPQPLRLTPSTETKLNTLLVALGVSFT